MKKNETILCAAIWVDNGNAYPRQPKNIYNGFVVCGHRHHNCFGTLSLIWNSDLERIAVLRSSIQGFLTSEGNFVSRQKGMEIAIESGQGGNNGEMTLGESLYSEDLY